MDAARLILAISAASIVILVLLCSFYFISKQAAAPPFDREKIENLCNVSISKVTSVPVSYFGIRMGEAFAYDSSDRAFKYIFIYGSDRNVLGGNITSDSIEEDLKKEHSAYERINFSGGAFFVRGAGIGTGIDNFGAPIWVGTLYFSDAGRYRIVSVLGYKGREDAGHCISKEGTLALAKAFAKEN